MTIHANTSRPKGAILPQYGFGSDTSFQSLVSENPYLFRIYTPKERSPFFDDTDPYFLAPRFNERYTRSPVEIRDHRQFDDEWNVNYADVAKHMDWTTRTASPFISTSLSFAWCIWDSLRRFHQGVKKDVQVAIIDGRAIADRAATAVELLEMSSPNERTKDHWKWHRFSQESQSVLVHGSIPGTAVLASIPLLAILRHLPSYFLRNGYHTPNVENPLTEIGWNYTDKKLSYRRFCRDMSDRFHALSTEERLADSTAGALALALAFLRPWFHQNVDVDCTQAVQTLTDLAYIIAQWPGQWWVWERPEIRELTHAMALTLYRELREKRGLQMKGEVSRLQGVVDELHGVVREYEGRFNSLSKRPKADESKKRRPSLFVDLQTPIFSPPVRESSLSPTRTTPIPIRVQTPLTPPDTPKSSSFTSLAESQTSARRAVDKSTDPSPYPRLGLQWTPSLGVPTTPLSAAAASSINAIANQSIPPSKHDNFGGISSSPSSDLKARPKLSSAALVPPLLQSQHSHASSSGLSELRPEEVPLPSSPIQSSPTTSEEQSGTASVSPSSYVVDDSWDVILSHADFSSDSDDVDGDTQVDEDDSYRKELQDSTSTLRENDSSPPGSPTLVIAPLPDATTSKVGLEYLPPRPLSGIFAEPLELDYIEVDSTEVPRGLTRMLERAGCLFTGLLIGATVTVAVFNPQRPMFIPLT